MTDNTNEGGFLKPVIQGYNIPSGGEPEEGAENESVTPATAKGEETPDQETPKGDSLNAENERLEEERKQLARIASDQGRKTKQAKMAALDAIASMSNDKAEAFLDNHPELQDDFYEAYPDKFETPPANISAEEEEIPTEPKPKTVKIDQESLVAETLARTAQAMEKQEAETVSAKFALENGLKRDDQISLKKIASAVVSADSSISFDQALKTAYLSKYGKEPQSSPGIYSPPSGSVEKAPSKESLDWWGKNVNSSLEGDKAIQAQKGADEFHKMLTKS